MRTDVLFQMSGRFACVLHVCSDKVAPAKSMAARMCALRNPKILPVAATFLKQVTQFLRRHLTHGFLSAGIYPAGVCEGRFAPLLNTGGIAPEFSPNRNQFSLSDNIW